MMFFKLPSGNQPLVHMSFVFALVWSFHFGIHLTQGQETPFVSPSKQIQKNHASSEKSPDSSTESSAANLKPSKASKASTKKTIEISQERRKEILAFAKENHPAIKPLMDRLRKKSPDEYEAAIRSMHKSVSRVQQIKDETRREMATRMWVVKSKIQLLSAQLAINDSPKIRKELKSLIGARIDLKVEQLKYESDQLQKRVEKVNQELDQAVGQRDSVVERQFNAAVRSSERVKQKYVKKKNAKRRQAGANKQDEAGKNRKSKSKSRRKDGEGSKEKNNQGGV